LDPSDVGEALDPLDERVFDGLAKAAGEGEKPLRRERLAAKEERQMVERRAPDCGDGGGVEIHGEIDPGDLGAERAGNGAYLKETTHRLGIMPRKAPLARGSGTG